MKYVLRYLKGTKELKIKYNEASDARLIGYSDSDWGENKDDHHSTAGHVFLLENGAISWALQWQKTIALSVGEAEYMKLATLDNKQPGSDHSVRRLDIPLLDQYHYAQIIKQ